MSKITLESGKKPKKSTVMRPSTRGRRKKDECVMDKLDSFDVLSATPETLIDVINTKPKKSTRKRAAVVDQLSPVKPKRATRKTRAKTVDETKIDDSCEIPSSNKSIKIIGENGSRKKLTRGINVQLPNVDLNVDLVQSNSPSNYNDMLNINNYDNDNDFGGARVTRLRAKRKC